jgi:hypothetical protein
MQLVDGSAAERDLAEYLKVLRHLGAAYRAASAVSLPCFARLLEEAFSAAAPLAAPSDHLGLEAPPEGYRLWEETITSQLADLREMAAAGILENEWRGFGVDAPSGARWYNFDPRTYLECAVAGTFVR